MVEWHHQGRLTSGQCPARDERLDARFRAGAILVGVFLQSASGGVCGSSEGVRQLGAPGAVFGY